MTIRISGIRVHAGLATPLAVAVVIGGAASTLDRSATTEFAFASLAALLAVSALALHELVRIAVYRRQGVAVQGIDLSLAGGSPSLIDHSATPKRDVCAGASGLAFLTAFAACAWWLERTTASGASHDIARLIAVAAVSLALLHAMPAPPLDGGRLLRGLVWFLTDDPVKGVRTTAAYGQLIAFALIAGGTMLLPESGDLPYWGFGAIVAGLQLAALSAAAYRESRWQAAGAATTLAEASLPLPGRVPHDADLETVVDALIAEGDRSMLLVIDDDNRPVGIIRLRDLHRVRRAEWAGNTAGQIMTPLSDIPRLAPDMTALDALTELDTIGARAAVAHLDDRHVILVLRDQLIHLLVKRSEGSGPENGTWPPNDRA